MLILAYLGPIIGSVVICCCVLFVLGLLGFLASQFMQSDNAGKLIDKIDAYILNKILADYKLFKNLDKQLLNKKITSFSNDIFKLTEEFSKKSNVPDVVNIQINELSQEIEKLKVAYAKEQNTLSVHESKLNKLLLQEDREYFDIVFYGNTYKNPS